MKRKPAPKPMRPAYTITETLPEKERYARALSEWTLTTASGRKAYIYHWHMEGRRASVTRGAWYEVTDGALSRYVHERDFSAAITAALDLVVYERKRMAALDGGAR